MRKLGCLVLLVLFGYIAYNTNPDKEMHIENACEILKESGVENFGLNSVYMSIGEGLLGKDRMQSLMSKFIVRKNYLFFSLTQIEIDGDEEIVALGMFGKMWNIGPLVDFVEEKAAEIGNS